MINKYCIKLALFLEICRHILDFKHITLVLSGMEMLKIKQLTILYLIYKGNILSYPQKLEI